MHWTPTLPILGVGYDDAIDPLSSWQVLTMRSVPATAVNGDDGFILSKAPAVGVATTMTKSTTRTTVIDTAAARPAHHRHQQDRDAYSPSSLAKTMTGASLRVKPLKEIVWWENFQKVKEFYDEHGHLTFPRFGTENIKLRQWLTYQRHYKSLRKDQRLQLESINYKDSQKLKLQAHWQSQFNKVKEYKQIHGDCNVPCAYIEDPSLGGWVGTQRRQYASMKEGKSTMDLDRVEKLNSIGFSWSRYERKHKDV